VAKMCSGVAEAGRGPGVSAETRGLTYPAIRSFSARDEQHLCGFALDRDSAADDARSRTVLFAHCGDD
jgi:hypothetical protein